MLQYEMQDALRNTEVPIGLKKKWKEREQILKTESTGLEIKLDWVRAGEGEWKRSYSKE